MTVRTFNLLISLRIRKKYYESYELKKKHEVRHGGGAGMNKNNKGYGNKGGKGYGGNWGKGGKGKGVYGLDLMGGWAADDGWTKAGNQWAQDDGGQWDNGHQPGAYSLQPTYSRALNVLQPAPISISDRFSAIAEPPPVAYGSQEVPTHLTDEPGVGETHDNSIDSNR